MKFTPGPGIGGHCIPLDPHYLAWKMRTLNYKTRFIDLASEINSEMPAVVAEKVALALNDDRKAVNGSRIIVVGVAYKKDVDDVRESPALEIMEILQDKGAVLSYSDPYIPRLHRMRKYDFSNMVSIDLTDEAMRSQDAVIITTDHTNIDYQRVVDNSKLVVDTRNATRNVTRGREKIVRA